MLDVVAQVQAPDSKRTRTRFDSVDIVRGIAVAGMVLVNNPGSWTDGYALLAHAKWNGWTLADLVFPFFLFVVGVSIAISIGGRMNRGEKLVSIAAVIIRRGAILFALGLLLNGFPEFDLSKIRIPGVLQRIALCYGVAALLFVKTSAKGQTIATLLLLAAYWGLMTLVPVPGHGAGVLDERGNLAAYLDDLCLRGHLYHEGWDPEGILSTAPAVATTLFGVLAGRWIVSTPRALSRSLGLIVAGSAAIVAGELMNPWFPINKQLWTSSFAVFTAGVASVSFGVCYWLVEAKGYRRWATPFIVLGTNALAVYTLTSLGASILERVQVMSPAGISEGLRLYIFEHVFLRWTGSRSGSLAFAVTYLLLWLWPMALLYRRRIFIRI